MPLDIIKAQMKKGQILNCESGFSFFAAVKQQF